MTNKEIFSKIKAIFAELKFVETKLADGTNVSYDKLEASGKFLLRTDSETSIPAPKGDYLLPDGQTVTVNEDGIISKVEVIEVPVKVKEDEEIPVKEPIIDEPQPINEPVDTTVTDNLKEEIVVLNEKVMQLENVLSELGIKFSKLEDKPAVTPLNFTVTKEEKNEVDRISIFKKTRK